ncbi:hypothetical protein DY000_02004834 [Brassica cretica]|uniref:PUB domain-containing protein n=1 Tax=Brassica cretica TaxID=69181 RepID=A0ABQ7BUS7_BRACR|nr:hypothetical protein DY000_02004834 [Brassica cretica]
MGKHEEKGQRQEDGPSRGQPGRTGPDRGIAPERSAKTDHPADGIHGQHQSAESDQRARGWCGQPRTCTVDVRGFSPERSSFDGTDRGPRPRVGAVRGRCQDQLTHLPFGSNPGLSGRPEKVSFDGEHKQEEIVVVNEVDGLEGQEELCFVNANGTWYKKEPHFQYQNNYQQKPFYNNQQGSYQTSQNYSQGFSSKGNQSTQGQAGFSTSAPQESSTDAMLKQILESQTRSEKHIGYELKNLHTKAAAQLVDKTEHKAMGRVKAQAELKVAAEILKRDEHKAEKQVEREAVQRLKEVKLEGTTEIKQSPYDKLPFPQRVLLDMGFAPNKAYKIMGSVHLKEGD